MKTIIQEQNDHARRDATTTAETGWLVGLVGWLGWLGSCLVAWVAGW